MTTRQFSVEGKTAIVTGSSSGIGEAIVKRFAEDGADVVVTSREQENVQPVADEIEDGSQYPGRAIAVEADVTDRDAVEALVDTTVEEFGSLDSMINNAGASFVAEFDEMSENGWKTIVDINLHGTFHCSQVAGQQMQHQDDGGTIINLSSVAGQRGSRTMAHYGAAKAAVINVTTALAADYAQHDIRVNCIAPGLVATYGVREQMGIEEPEEINRDEVDRTIGRPVEVADLAQFLASEASSYIIGETLTIKGKPQLEE